MRRFVINHQGRKLNRLNNYDYSCPGTYFVTICIKGKEEFFGEIKNSEMILNECGKIVKKCWLEIPDHFPDVTLDEFVVMPNHVHGIVIIKNKNDNNIFVGNDNVGNKNFCSLREIPWQTKLSRSLPSIIRGFKIGVTKWCRVNIQYYFQWQKSFYDHIVRDKKSLNKIREYIQNNPIKWDTDKNNQENLYYGAVAN